MSNTNNIREIRYKVTPDNVDDKLNDLYEIRTKENEDGVQIVENVNTHIRTVEVLKREYTQIDKSQKMIGELNDYKVITNNNKSEYLEKANNLKTELAKIDSDKFPSVVDVDKQVDKEIKNAETLAEQSKEIEAILNRLVEL